MSGPLDLAYELHDLVLTMDRDATAILEPLGLTLRQHTALVIIGEHPGLRSRDLAAGLGVTPAAATGLVRVLTGEGLVKDEARRGEGNRRSLHLTPEGSHLLARSAAALAGDFDELVRRTGHDPEQLAAALRDITDGLRATHSHPRPPA